MHGFCTDFARFQNVQRVQIVAKLDKGCRNCWVKNYVALIKNNDNSKLPETETNRRLALLISGPRVRVPGGAPQQQNPNFFPIGEGFGFFVFFGKQNESFASIENCGREPLVRRLKAKQKQGAPLNEQRPICPTEFGLTNGAFLYVGKNEQRIAENESDFYSARCFAR